MEKSSFALCTVPIEKLCNGEGIDSPSSPSSSTSSGGGSGGSFLSTIPHPVDGAVVTSRNERDINCVVTFQVGFFNTFCFCSMYLRGNKLIFSQTESILECFMLRFEELAIDCNDRLVIYDGAHAIGNHKVSTRSITFCKVGKIGYYFLYQ